MAGNSSGSFLLGAIAIIGIIGGGWLYTNYEPRTIGSVFLILSIIGLIVAVLNRPIAAFFGRTGDTGGADLRYKTQVFLGVLLGFIPIILSLAFSFSIATPVLVLTKGITFVIVVFVAPVVEEIFFLFVVPYLLGLLLWRLGVLGFIINILLSSAIFAMYHWLAYGAVFAASGEFLGAFVFRLITLLIVAWLSKSTRFTPSDVGRGIIVAIIMHAMFNGFIQAKGLFILPEAIK